MIVSQNLYDALTLAELESLATNLGMTIRHTTEERTIMKCKLTIQIAERLLKDQTDKYTYPCSK